VVCGFLVGVISGEIKMFKSYIIRENAAYIGLKEMKLFPLKTRGNFSNSQYCCEVYYSQFSAKGILRSNFST